jgi:Flp pilus assembly pilin Flp
MLSWDRMKLYATRENGQTMAEYGVVLAVLTVGVIAALGAIAVAITGNINTIIRTLGGVLP